MVWLEGGLVASGRGLPGRDVTPGSIFPGPLVSRMPAARDFHALLADACFVSPEELADCGEVGGWRIVAALLFCIWNSWSPLVPA